jgi:hypothetical protein
MCVTELAYLLLVSLPTPHLSNVQDRIAPLLRIDILSILPQELSRFILQHLSIEDIIRCSVCTFYGMAM